MVKTWDLLETCTSVIWSNFLCSLMASHQVTLYLWWAQTEALTRWSTCSSSSSDVSYCEINMGCLICCFYLGNYCTVVLCGSVFLTLLRLSWHCCPPLELMSTPVPEMKWNILKTLTQSIFTQKHCDLDELDCPQIQTYNSWIHKRNLDGWFIQ